MARQTVRIDYAPPGETIERFMVSDAFVRGIRGPVGSGKSTACVMEILRRAAMQQPGLNGKRTSRWAIIRQTYGELLTTTVKTWHQWLPKHIGRWREQAPFSHHIQEGDLDLEVLFLALDRPDDIKKLLSLELTGAWINETREVPKAVFDTITGRVGRFPSKRDGGPSWFGVIMDTNPSDTDHWWYRLAEDERPGEFAFFAQPPGDTDEAENVENLPDGYYERLKAGKTEDWIKVYVRGEYGYVQDGKPVFPEYRDSMHCRAFELLPGLPLHIGVDFGLTPAAVIGQRAATGQIRIRHEVVAERMGAKNFAQELNRWLNGTLAFYEIEAVTGDPAGNAESQTDEETPFRILRAADIPAQPASTNDFTIRREAVADALSRLIEGEPGIIIHPDCRVLRKGLMGAYRFRRVQVAGDERYHDKPDKNFASHPADALQYLLLGMGEGRAVVRRSKRVFREPSAASVRWVI